MPLKKRRTQNWKKKHQSKINPISYNHTSKLTKNQRKHISTITRPDAKVIKHIQKQNKTKKLQHPKSPNSLQESTHGTSKIYRDSSLIFTGFHKRWTRSSPGIILRLCHNQIVCTSYMPPACCTVMITSIQFKCTIIQDTPFCPH